MSSISDNPSGVTPVSGQEPVKGPQKTTPGVPTGAAADVADKVASAVGKQPEPATSSGTGARKVAVTVEPKGGRGSVGQAAAIIQPKSPGVQGVWANLRDLVHTLRKFFTRSSSDYNRESKENRTEFNRLKDETDKLKRDVDNLTGKDRNPTKLKSFFERGEKIVKDFETLAKKSLHGPRIERDLGDLDSQLSKLSNSLRFIETEAANKREKYGQSLNKYIPKEKAAVKTPEKFAEQFKGVKRVFDESGKKLSANVKTSIEEVGSRLATVAPKPVEAAPASIVAPKPAAEAPKSAARHPSVPVKAETPSPVKSKEAPKPQVKTLPGSKEADQYKRSDTRHREQMGRKDNTTAFDDAMVSKDVKLNRDAPKNWDQARSAPKPTVSRPSESVSQSEQAKLKDTPAPEPAPVESTVAHPAVAAKPTDKAEVAAKPAVVAKAEVPQDPKLAAAQQAFKKFFGNDALDLIRHDPKNKKEDTVRDALSKKDLQRLTDIANTKQPTRKDVEEGLNIVRNGLTQKYKGSVADFKHKQYFKEVRANLEELPHHLARAAEDRGVEKGKQTAGALSDIVPRGKQEVAADKAIRERLQPSQDLYTAMKEKGPFKSHKLPNDAALQESASRPGKLREKALEHIEDQLSDLNNIRTFDDAARGKLSDVKKQMDGIRDIPEDTLAIFNSLERRATEQEVRQSEKLYSTMKKSGPFKSHPLPDDVRLKKSARRAEAAKAHVAGGEFGKVAVAQQTFKKFFTGKALKLVRSDGDTVETSLGRGRGNDKRALEALANKKNPNQQDVKDAIALVKKGLSQRHEMGRLFGSPLKFDENIFKDVLKNTKGLPEAPAKVAAQQPAAKPATKPAPQAAAKEEEEIKRDEGGRPVYPKSQ